MGSAHAAIYRSVDAQGNVVFSDQPTGNAHEISLPPITTYSPPPKTETSPATPATTTLTLPAAASYQQFSVVAPVQDQAFWDNTGDVDVHVAIQPALNTDAGHRFVFYLDGTTEGEPVSGPATVFHNVDRGEHTVWASVVDAQGQTIATTEKVRFQLHRQALNSPLKKNKTGP